MRIEKILAFFLLFAHAPLWAHPDPRLHQHLLAQPITHDNFSKIIRGSSAVAGINDWMLSNGTLCASISDPEHETYLSYRGGTLVDLGFCGRNDDQWNTYHELFNLDRAQILPATEIKTEVTAESASVIVKGKIAGVENITRYTLDIDHPRELLIETQLTRQERSSSEKANALYLFGALILHPHRSLTPFVLSTKNPEYSKGFQHPFADTNDKLGMLKVMFPADLHVLVGPDHLPPEISYGVQSLSAELIDKKNRHHVLREFAINDQEFTLLGNFTNPLWIDTKGQPGLLQFAQSRLMDLAVGESLLLKKRILVSQKADVASITDDIYSGAMVSGHTNSAENRILVTDGANHPLTFIKPDSQGNFSARIPKDITQVKLVLNTSGKDAVRTLLVNTAENKRVTLESEPVSAHLLLPRGLTLRLTFKGINGTADPVFFPDTLNFRVGEKRFAKDISSNSLSLAGIDQDLQEVSIPAGAYTVYATRGPEFSLTKTTIHLDANEIKRLSIDAPKQVIQTPGWISADFHVHSEFSFDSTLPAQQRVIDFVAQGSEVMVSTEHKRTINYQPIVEALHLQHKVIAIAGVELTGMAHTDKIPRTMGHSNVFPLIAQDEQFMGGTLPHENRRLGEVIQEYKKKYPNVVFQLNHPRVPGKIDGDTDDDINYFNHLSIGKKYNPELLLTDKQNASLIEKLAGSEYRDIDFDAIELLNGQEMSNYALVRKDWLSLLLQGYRKTATADSDSHDSGQIVAMPRNYIHMDAIHIGHDTIETFDKNILAQAVLRGDAFGTTGPLLDVHLENKGMGDTWTGTQGILTVDIRMADWIPVSRLLVSVSGELVKTIPVTKPGRYETLLHFNKDSFVTVEVEGSASGDYAAVYPGFVPFAFSNPVFVKTK